MANPFATSPLGPTANLNFVRLAGLPPFAARFEGRTVWQILHRSESEKVVQSELPEWSASPDPLILINDLQDRHPALGRVASEIGDRLAALLWVLHYGPLEARAANNQWNDEAWRFWRGIRTFAGGGGQVAGKLGPLIVDRVNDVLNEAAAIRLAPAPGVLPLLGCARRLPPLDGLSLVLDAGGSSVKRGLAHIMGGRLVALELLDTFPVPWGLDADGILAELDLMTAGYSQEVLPMSVNCYVDRVGNPLEDTFVGMLRHATADVPGYIADRLGRFGRVELVHDGTAAALAYAGRPETAVLTLGTSVGCGIPPAMDEGLLPVELPEPHGIL